MNTADNKNTIGERIKNFRSDSLHMTQRDFAEELGLQPSTLSGYEKGNIIPSTDILLKIARKYNLSLDWLCGLTNNAFQFNDLGEIVDALIKLNDLNEIRYEIERN
ncbi:MAG: helix-turn-helix domain-containing protein, partial [Lachnospiraceae bacterium]|nr:helix-turn-helix domain-containing protein [Lachnospiraceae bacterium]